METDYSMKSYSQGKKYKYTCRLRSQTLSSKQRVLMHLHTANHRSKFSLSLEIGFSLPTVLCKSNANDNRRISRFVLAIYRRYISETSRGLPNVKTINHRDIGTIFAISRRDIVLARLPCNDISQSKRYITTIYRCSEVRCNDMS